MIKTRTLGLKVSEEYYDELKELAKREGISLSDFFREALKMRTEYKSMTELLKTIVQDRKAFS